VKVLHVQPLVDIGCGSSTEEGDCVLSFIVQRPLVRSGMNFNESLCLAN